MRCSDEGLHLAPPLSERRQGRRGWWNRSRDQIEVAVENTIQSPASPTACAIPDEWRRLLAIATRDLQLALVHVREDALGLLDLGRTSLRGLVEWRGDPRAHLISSELTRRGRDLPYVKADVFGEDRVGAKTRHGQ